MQSNLPLVSVITPVYRCAETLLAALQSLQKQSEQRWESIIIDDGSPDHSYEIAKNISVSDNRFKVLSQKNAGACAARNTGLRVASGRYILFLDADDWMESDALAAMIRQCERRHLGAVHGAFHYAKPDGSPTQWTGTYDGGGVLFDALAASNVLSLPSCVLLRKAVLDEIGGGFDTALAHCGDWDLWSRVARTDWRIEYLDNCVTHYRMRPASLSRNPMTLLRDATTVLQRIHGRDSRVTCPSRRSAGGAPASELKLHVAGFTFYAAAFAAMQGNMKSALAAMDTVRRWPIVPPKMAAQFLLHATCFSRCVGPEDLMPLPADIRQTMDQVIYELQHRLDSEGWSAAVFDALDDLGCRREEAELRTADRARLERPRSATDTLAFEYLRSLALRECAVA